MVRGRESGCHQPGRPLVCCVRIRRGVLTGQLGRSIGADLSLPSPIFGNGSTVSHTLLLWDDGVISPHLVHSSIANKGKINRCC